MARERLIGRLVPIGSLLLFGAMVGLMLAAAKSTLGYDYTCYAGAARSLLDGHPIYDRAFAIDVGTCPGTYTYPPPFLALVLPLQALPAEAAAWTWCLAMAAAFLAGAALLPLRRDVRWAIVVLGALDWPLLYSVKLGQVGPLLFLLFAATWRWLDRPRLVGTASAAGALVKVQPALVLLWAVATRRYRAAAIGLLTAVLVVLASIPLVGLGAWRSYLELLLGLNGTLGTEHNVALGAVAIHAGLPSAAASATQLASALAAIVLLLVAWRWAPADASLLATILVSQLVASPLRDHYAVLLLLPTAWLLERGHAWAIVFPLAGWASLPAIGSASNWFAGLTVPLTFFACLAAVLVVALRERRSGKIDRSAEAQAAATRQRQPLGGASA